MGHLHHYVREGERERPLADCPGHMMVMKTGLPTYNDKTGLPASKTPLAWDNDTVTLQLAYCVTVSRHFLFLIRYKIIIEQPKVEFSLTWN